MAENQAKAKGMISRSGGKSLKSLMHEIGSFREMVYFQWLDPKFVLRDCVSVRRAPMKSATPACRSVLKNSNSRQSAGQENVGFCQRPLNGPPAPGADRDEVWLKVHGASLHRFGAT
jgi:hypothetical protein